MAWHRHSCLCLLRLDVYDAAIAAQEGSQGCERFLRAPLVCVVTWKRAASAALDGVPDLSSAADAARNPYHPQPGVLAKNARTPGYRLVAANAAKGPVASRRRVTSETS